MFTTHLDDHTTAADHTTEPRIPVTVKRRHDSITFHVTRNPEFVEGIRDGRKYRQQELTGQSWEAENLLQFVQQEVSHANEERLDTPPHTPVYHLGLVAGLLSLLADAALKRSYDGIARDPEVFQGVTHGRQLLPTDWDLNGKNALWEVADLIQFVQQELSPASLVKENEIRECFDAPPHTPVYNLGLIAGLLSLFADAALKATDEGGTHA